MKYSEIVERIRTVKNGAYTHIEWERGCKVKKGSPCISKHTSGTFRIGVEYDHLTAVKEGRSDGSLPAENAGILRQNMEWIRYPYLTRSIKSGQVYLRVYTCPHVTTRPVVSYIMEEHKVSFSEVEKYLYSSEKPDKSTDEKKCFYLKVDDIQRIG